MNCRYHFWIPDLGMPKPEEIPKGCEIHMGAGSWGEAFIEPKDWKDGLFRWPKA